ncbi:cytochrome P450 [Pilatotrama ljubarskyi]|nr:cytochrome P450 [Pilatotrama ljubarskyi]
MFALLLWPPALAGLVFSLFLVLKLITAHHRQQRFPPGPSSGGALRKALKRNPHELFAGWSKQYSSPVVSVGILWKRVVVVNAFEVADALLNKRSAAFSDRPNRFVSLHRCDYDRGMAFMSQGPRLKQTRSLYQQALNAHVISLQLPYFERQTPRFLASLLDKPKDLHEHIHFFYTKTILDWTLGYHAESLDDTDLLYLSEKVSNNSTHMLAASTQLWVEMFPFFKVLPVWMVGHRTASTIQQFKRELAALFLRTDEHVRRCLVRHPNGGPSSFMSSILNKTLSDEEKDVALYSSASLTAAGFHTMISITTTFFFAMMRYPEAQREAQEEIDRVVGRHRLPTAADQASLPFTEALITEVMRWLPPVALTSRSLKQDEWYEDMLFPRGCTILTNVWAMTRDESRFPDPHEFCPERYLVPSEDGSMKLDILKVRHVRHLGFGFGRRVCPGRFFADALLWITLSRVLATMSITPPKDQPVAIPEVIDSVVIRFEEFACQLKERYEGAGDLVRAAEAEVGDAPA